MLINSGHIQESDAYSINKRRTKTGQPLAEPLNTQEDVALVAQYFIGIDLGEEFEPLPGVIAGLVEAGHAPGGLSRAA